MALRGKVKAFTLGAATGCCFLFFWSGSFLLSWLVLPAVHLLHWRQPPLERARRCREIVGLGFRLFHAVMRTARTLVFHPREVKLDLPAGPFLMIANHPTLIDVTALMAVCPRVCCVAKTELFRSIVVGPLLRLCGHIEAGESRSMEGAAVIRQALDLLGRGDPLLIFPEGTRSPRDGLRQFKRGAFELASRAVVPIVPVLITCNPPTLAKGMPWYALPKTTARYRLTQLETVSYGTASSDAAALAKRIEASFRDRIGAWRTGIAENDSATSAGPSANLASRRPTA